MRTIAATILICLALTGLAAAQTLQPTPEQMRQIQQLPPELREQALEALQESQRSSLDGKDSGAKPKSTTKPSTTPEDEEDEEDEELRVEANSKLIINLMPYALLSEDELEAISDDIALSRLQGSHYHEVDANGILLLPGIQEVVLLGLNAETAAERLGAIPAFDQFEITVTILEEQPVGPLALEPFGYDIFEPREDDDGQRDDEEDEDRTDTFEPSTAGPVPHDYILGPGDVIRVQLFGAEQGDYEFEVTRSGVLNFPRLGPVTAAGIPFSELRDDLRERVKDMLIGTQVSITMGELRSIRVFILGDANRPGSYVVSSLATISSALYRSGGISRIGSLRRIQLKRQGDLVAEMDLYDLLLRGDTSNDLRLQDGDVIFVPPIGNTVGVTGAIRRPAIYEIKSGYTVSDAVRIGGGLLPEADSSAATLERIRQGVAKNVVNVNLRDADDAATRLDAGDLLRVPEILPDLTDSVKLVGHIHRPGGYQWIPGMRLTDLIPSALQLKSGADVNYLLIRRESAIDRTVSIVSADLGAALLAPTSDANIRLQGRDTVQVFDLAFDRQRIIEPILEELKLQARYGAPFNQVNIGGNVRSPGAYPLEVAMHVSDLIRAGGGMVEGAYAQNAELTRYDVVEGRQRGRALIDVDLNGILLGNQIADLPLQPHDHLNISLIPDWDSEWSVTVEGEVRFPGEYQVLRGETLAELVKRAGGLTERAFPEGAIFLRESLVVREKEQLEVLARRMESDLASLSLQAVDTSGAEALSVGQSLLLQLRATEPVGRLVIDADQFEDPEDPNRAARNLELKDGDRLLVPTNAQEVTVIGEAQYNTSHLFQTGLTRDDYIALSGGFTRKADEKLIYVVRASGAVVSASGSRWFGRGGNTEIRPGDTIVIPLEVDRIRSLTFWTNVTQILYQGAIAVAALKTFSN